MPQLAKAILHQALELPSNDRAALVEGLIKPNPALDAMWLKEAEDRWAAYHACELRAVDAERVFVGLRKKVWVKGSGVKFTASPFSLKSPEASVRRS